MKWFYSLVAKLFGFNSSFTPKEVIIDQMNEPRPLPMGKKEFEEWSSRIIGGALIPSESLRKMMNEEPKGREEYDAFIESQKFCLANMLLHLGPTESHKPDAFFIHSLRKFAINQVADAIRIELRDAAKARTAEDENAGGQVQIPSEVLV